MEIRSCGERRSCDGLQYQKVSLNFPISVSHVLRFCSCHVLVPPSFLQIVGFAIVLVKLCAVVFLNRFKVTIHPVPVSCLVAELSENRRIWVSCWWCQCSVLLRKSFQLDDRSEIVIPRKPNRKRRKI